MIYCDECRHAPRVDYWEIHGEKIPIPVYPKDSKCPCRCEGDPYYDKFPKGVMYCGLGEPRDEAQATEIDEK